MKGINKSQININNTSKETESPSLNKLFNIGLPALEKQPNFTIVNESVKQEENKKSIFISRKRGRKSIYQDEIKCENSIKNIHDIKFVHDKFSNDNIRRKIKALFHEYIINLLNNLIKQKFKGTTMKFFKMNMKITKDVTIEYNRSLLDKYIKDIIINVSKKVHNKDSNKICIKYIESQKNNKEIMQILNMKYKDLYSNHYLKSNKDDMQNDSFEAHKDKILNKFGPEYLSLFIKNTENFIEFYINGKNRKARKPKEVESIDISFGNENKETNKFINSNDIEKYYLNKNMISSSTETDIFGINKKLLIFA